MGLNKEAKDKILIYEPGKREETLKMLT